MILIAYFLLIVWGILSVVKASLSKLYLPLVVTDEVVEEGQNLFFKAVVPCLGSLLIFLLQSQGVQLGAVRKLRPLCIVTIETIVRL